MRLGRVGSRCWAPTAVSESRPARRPHVRSGSVAADSGEQFLAEVLRQLARGGTSGPGSPPGTGRPGADPRGRAAPSGSGRSRPSAGRSPAREPSSDSVRPGPRIGVQRPAADVLSRAGHFSNSCCSSREAGRVPDAAALQPHEEHRHPAVGPSRTAPRATAMARSICPSRAAPGRTPA